MSIIILKIDSILKPNVEFGDIFFNDLDATKDIYRTYCKQYHPDVCNDSRATEAFQRINLLYNEAVEAIKNGTWRDSKYVFFKCTNGKKIKIQPKFRGAFELGEYYVTNSRIIYCIDEKKKKFSDNLLKQTKGLRYEDKKMRDMFERFFPQIVDEFNTTDGKHILVLKKTEDIYPLRCVVENFYDFKVPPAHMAWIISRMLNLCCFLKYNNKVANGINLDNCFVSLEHHAIILNGFWYATSNDDNMIGTTREILNIMPPKVKADKKSNFMTDIESVKLFGRKYIADGAPQAILDFLNSGSTEDSFSEMKKWDAALLKGFGKRKFIKIEVNEEKIYKRKGE